jgi:ectoine hydroxylase-related dioxygenase (phytanoyl-CoA dioxygenase family)
MESTSLADHVERIRCQGYTIVPDAIEPHVVDAMNDDLARLEQKFPAQPVASSITELVRILRRSPAERRCVKLQANTVRFYNLVVHGEVWQRIAMHERVLPIVEAVLGDDYLIASLFSVNIGPGETAQPIHTDDVLSPNAIPHPPTTCHSMCALTDFTEANGATRMIPGSHTPGYVPGSGRHRDAIAAEMTRGSVLIRHGNLWHGGGANRTAAPRIGVAAIYRATNARKRESEMLDLPPAVVRTLPHRLQELIGLPMYAAPATPKQTPPVAGSITAEVAAGRGEREAAAERAQPTQ